MKESQIILIDKPSGITSFDVIRILRKKLGIKKMGHAGTLDPLATGLLIIGIGEGTKELTRYIKLSKTYEAEILFGTKTDTGDIDGKILDEKPASHISEKEIKNAIEKIVGTHSFSVPFYSAIKVSGVRLYAHARKGTTVEIPKKEMTVYSASLTHIENSGEKVIASVSMDVSSGTYVRTIAEEIGRVLSIPATVRNLRRTRIGDFLIKDAIRVSDIPDA